MIRYSLSDILKKLQHIPYFQETSGGLILKSIPFFQDIDESVLMEASPSVTFKEYTEDEIVCRHGKFDQRFFYILSGSARAIIPTENNPRYELYSLQSGDFFGEEVIFSTGPRENTIIVNDTLFALSINSDVLKKIIESNKETRNLVETKYFERKLKIDLRSVPVFTSLNETLFKKVLERLDHISIPSETVVFKEKEQGDSFYLIRQGEVKVYHTVNEKEHLIAILGEGQFFGEMSLLSDESRNATVITSCNCDFVKLDREEFIDIVRQDDMMLQEIMHVAEARKGHRKRVLESPNIAIINQKLMKLSKEVNRHLDILSQCTIDTEKGSALLATLPGSRYPYVYPRDSACASRFLFKLIMSNLRSGEIAFRLLGEISRFIMNCQREDGYWGQRYGINGEDKGIYIQEDNVAHGVSILCRYLLAAKYKGIAIPKLDRYIEAIDKGAAFARTNYYRNEIHLFYSTTSIHESAIEEGYSIWVNYAYLTMLRLIESVCKEYDILDRFPEEMELKSGFEITVDKVFSISGRYVRRLRPDGVVDLRPDITLISPFFFGTGLENDFFDKNNETFKNAIDFVVDTLWDPDLQMLQRYLPFIEDPDTHIHAGNGPWIQYTVMLAQYYFYIGEVEKGNEVLSIVDSYKSKEGYLCEHLTTPERFFEFKRLEWMTGSDFEKEFDPKILTPGLSYDNIVEELTHMKNAYEDVEAQCLRAGDGGNITFATPLMWSHAEYGMALLMRTEQEIKQLYTV